MSLSKGKPQKRREDAARPQPRRRRVPRREETIISLTPLPSGLLIKEFTKQNKLIRSAFQPLSGELVPVDDPNDLPEIKDVRPKWRKNFAGALPHQRKLKLHKSARHQRENHKPFAGKAYKAPIITPKKPLSKTLQVNGVLYPITGLDKVYRFAQTRSFLAGHRVSAVFPSSSEVYKQIVPVLDILNWGGQSPSPDFEDDGPSGGKGKR